MKFEDGTYEIIGCAMKVHSALGPGLREKPYENALMIASRKAGITAEQQRAYTIRFEDEMVGDCITVGDVLVDAKSIPAVGDPELSQMLNYLRISKKQIRLIINFRNGKLEFQRVVL